VKRLTLDTQTAMKPLDIGMFHIAAGSAYQARKSTASSVFCVISGSGRAKIGSLDVQWSVGDVLAAPAWNPIELKADADAVLLEVSDSPTLRMLGFYREG
jgi:gentisate 1,2-dioxygenase